MNDNNNIINKNIDDLTEIFIKSLEKVMETWNDEPEEKEY